MTHELIFNTQLIQFLLCPFIDLKNQLNALLSGKHVIRSTIRIVAIIVGVASGLILFLNNILVQQSFISLALAMPIPQQLQPIVSLYLSVLTSGGVTSFLAKTLIKGCCLCIFGDPDFFLTKKREMELEMVFREQGYTVTRQTIRRVIDFCINNLRKPPSRDIGSCSSDWKRVLDALLYEADLEVFLEQQEFLLNKLQKTTEKCKALSKYGSTFDLETAFNQMSILNKFEREISESDHLLATPPSIVIPPPIPAVLQEPNKEKTLALKVLHKFKSYHPQNDIKNILHHCSKDLKRKELQLMESICPLQISPSSTPPTTPNSDEAGTIVSYRVTSSPSGLQPKPDREHRRNSYSGRPRLVL
jgi:hypothetical protein